ncbi:MAG: CRTAC1 family protein [Planctomycetota bacterium]|nr:CRTAC1 family protein [Planctomycetota bacterium]
MRPLPLLPAFSLALHCATPCVVGQTYVDVTLGTGLVQAEFSSAEFGSGIAAGDIDGDGDIDLAVSNGDGGMLRLYRNDGGGQFTELPSLGSPPGQVHGLVFADVDNDGDQDLYVCGFRIPSMLFINQGGGTFVEEAASRGITHVTSNFGASFGDYDLDGWLDLYVSNRGAMNGRGQPNILYRNLGGGVFVDVSATAGVGDAGLTYAAAFCDVDEDGWPDLVIANDKGARGTPNEIYRNLGNGTFTAVGAQLRANSAIDAMGVDYTDVFNDGGVDLFFSDSAPDHLFLVQDRGTGAYVDFTTRCGMFSATDGWAVHFVDVDNDGWQDVHVVNSNWPNSVFRNPGQAVTQVGAWSDISAQLNLGQFYEQYSTTVLDFDDDGRLDFCHRFEQAGPPFGAPFGVGLMQGQGAVGQWIKFRTEGTVSNRDGLGTRVVVETGSHVQRQWVRSGIGFQSSSDPRLHFGLGAAQTVDRVSVRWPSGTEQLLRNVAASQIVTLVEPRFELAGIAAAGGSAVLQLDSPNDAGAGYAMVLAVSSMVPTPIPDGRTLPITVDALSAYSMSPGNILLAAPFGVVDGAGRASSALSLPNWPFLVGLTLSATALTVGAGGYPDVRTVFGDPVSFTVR